MRKCPRCHHEMQEDCYLEDKAEPIYDYHVIEKKSDYKKVSYPLKAALCKSCGYVEFYVDTNNEE